MTFGLLALKWNERSGIEIVSKYPEDVDSKLSKRDLFQIYNMHQYNQGKEGMVSLTLNSINFISYYSGEDSGYYIVLVLNILENPEDFEEILEELAHEVIERMNGFEDNDNHKVLKKKFLEYFDKSNLESQESKK
jgi:hypothetical protein